VISTENKNDIHSLSDSESTSSLTSTSSFKSEKIEAEKNTIITLEDCSVIYFSGYLAYKCIKKFNCEVCKVNLTSEKNLNNKNQILLIYKNYPDINKDAGLMAPSISLNNVIDRALNIFENIFEQIQHKKKSKKN